MNRCFYAALLLLAGLLSPAKADYAFTPGSGSTMFAFTCFTTKVCPAHVNVNNAGTEIFTAAVPGQVTGANGTFPVTQSTSPWVVSNGGTFAVQAAQTGTWTVQPGNTANTTAWLVTGTGGTFPATQSGTWNITNISGTVSLPTGASTAAKQPALGTAGTASADVITVQGIASMTPLLANPGTAANWAIGATGAAVPANAQLGGMSQGGNTTAFTGTSGNLNVQCANCSGSGVSTADEATFTAGSSLFAGSGGFFQTTATNNALTNGQQGMFQVTAQRALFSNLRNASGTEVGTSAAEVFVGGRGTAGTATGGVLTVQGVASMTPILATLSGTNNIATVTTVTTVSTLTGGGVASGSADSGNPLKVGGKYNSSPITLTDGQRGDLQLDASGFLKVNVATATGLAQGSTTSGQTGSLVMGAVTTAAPTYTTAQTSPLSLDTAGSLRVAITSGGGSGGTSSNFGSAFPTPGTAVGFTDGTNMVSGRVGDVNNVAAATNYLDVLGIGRYNATQPTLTDTRFNALQLSSRGELLVAPGTTGFAVTNAGTFAVQIAANSSVNVAQINGVTPLMGNGTTGTGSQRVTLASDGTAISTTGYMSVKIDQTTVGTTNAVSLAQIGANTVLTGNGTAGTGAQRVTIASDNTAFAVNATLSAETTKVIGTARILGNAGAIVDGATGAAPPSNVVYAGGLTSGGTGGLLTGIVVCDQNAFLNMTTATTTEIVALTASRQIMVCSYSVTTNGTSAVKFVRGTGTNCGTGTNDVTANDEWTAQTGMTRGSGLGTLFRVTSANALCVTTGSAVNVHINVTYAVI